MIRSFALCTAAIAALMTAGCGGSSSSTSTTSPTSSAAASTSAQSSSYSASATQTSAPAGSTGGASGELVSTKHNKLGTVLAAGSKQLTVYLFEADRGSTSSCSGACARVWPPVRSAGAATAAGAAVSSKLGTIKRADGATQVTYNGHPLYYYAKDGDSGDAYGQGVNSFGASWYVLAPAGAKIDKS